jgi:hypothetical protein
MMPPRFETDRHFVACIHGAAELAR